MSLIHDIVKINYMREGYLPSYNPSFIDDSEMCDAFLPVDLKIVGVESDGSDCCCPCFDDGTDRDLSLDDRLRSYYEIVKDSSCYFFDNYSLPDDGVKSEYIDLVVAIMYHLYMMKISSDVDTALPNWVYSYMLGATLSENSSQIARHEMLVWLDVDNLYDEFTAEVCKACYRESAYWLSKLAYQSLDHRPPTVFGEPHVIKSLRLKQADMFDTDLDAYIESTQRT